MHEDLRDSGRGQVTDIRCQTEFFISWLYLDVSFLFNSSLSRRIEFVYKQKQNQIKTGGKSTKASAIVISMNLKLKG